MDIDIDSMMDGFKDHIEKTFKEKLNAAAIKSVYGDEDGGEDCCGEFGCNCDDDFDGIAPSMDDNSVEPEDGDDSYFDNGDDNDGFDFSDEEEPEADDMQDFDDEANN